MIYDILIVGGGPAGSTLARLLEPKYKVLLIDKRNLRMNNDYQLAKCCGGLLAPAAQKVLAEFGLGVPKEVLVGPQMFTVRSVDFDNRLKKYYQRHYINVDREKFDRWLFSLIPSCVEIKDQCLFQDYNKVDGLFEVKVSQNGLCEIIKTKHIVGADGATSKLRRMTFKNLAEPDLYVAIQEWYETEEQLPHYVSVFDKEVTDFYSWVIQKDHGLILGAAIKDGPNANKNFNRLKEKLEEDGYKFGKAIKREGTWIMRPRRNNQINLYKENISLIGEAAGFISPSSAEGISYALRSGSLLAESMNDSIDSYGKLYSKKTRKLKLNIIVKNAKAMIMYNRLLRMLVMKIGVLSMKVDENNG